MKTLSNTKVQELKEVLQSFISYGMIHTVEGVVYPAGTHKQTIDKAVILFRYLDKN